MTLRQPAVAGSFYPGHPGELRDMVDRLLDEAAGARSERTGTPRAIVAPHAGYVYSGPIAARAFDRVRGTRFARVALLGPCHFVPLRGLAAPAADAFATPLGEVPLDRLALSRLAELPQVAVSDAPHAPEHSLEVELPFLQRILGEFLLVPLAVGDATPDEVAGVLDAVWDDQTLAVISSDLSHYLRYDEARRRDNLTARRICELRPVDRDDACGAAPVNGLVAAARRRGLLATLLDLRNSGDTAGDRSRVVGYGAFSFTEAA